MGGTDIPTAEDLLLHRVDGLTVAKIAAASGKLDRNDFAPSQPGLHRNGRGRLELRWDNGRAVVTA